MKTQLPKFPTIKTPINSLLSTVCKDGIVKYFHQKKLDFSHFSDDYIKFRYITSRYVWFKLCKQVEIARCFRVDPESVKYYANKLRKRGESVFFEGRPRKLTKEVVEFAREEFRRIYPKENYHYSSNIRRKIKNKFNKKLSSETLRKIFNEEKSNILAENFEIKPIESKFGFLVEKVDSNRELKKASYSNAKRDKSDARRSPNVLGNAKSTKPCRPRNIYI